MADFLFAGVLPERRPGSVRHAHDHWELICYVEITGVLTVGGQRIAFKPGMLAALPPHVSHEKAAPDGFRCLFIGMHGPRPRGPVSQDDVHGTFRSTAELLVREC